MTLEITFGSNDVKKITFNDLSILEHLYYPNKKYYLKLTEGYTAFFKQGALIENEIKYIVYNLYIYDGSNYLNITTTILKTIYYFGITPKIYVDKIMLSGIKEVQIV